MVLCSNSIARPRAIQRAWTLPRRSPLQPLFPTTPPSLLLMSAQASTGSTSATPSSLVVGCDNASSGAKEEAVEFVAISRSTHVYRPKKGVKQAKKDASSSLLSPIKVIQRGVLPNAVVILGWMDAPMRIVSKYAAPYAKLFPQATIIVKLSSGQSFMAGKAAQEAALQGVIRELEDVQRSVEAKSQLQSQVADLEKSANQAGLRLDVDSQNQLQEKAQSGEQSDASSSAAQASGILIHSCACRTSVETLFVLTTSPFLPPLSLRRGGEEPLPAARPFRGEECASYHRAHLRLLAGEVDTSVRKHSVYHSTG